MICQIFTLYQFPIHLQYAVDNMLAIGPFFTAKFWGYQDLIHVDLERGQSWKMSDLLCFLTKVPIVALKLAGGEELFPRKHDMHFYHIFRSLLEHGFNFMKVEKVFGLVMSSSAAVHVAINAELYLHYKYFLVIHFNKFTKLISLIIKLITNFRLYFIISLLKSLFWDIISILDDY